MSATALPTAKRSRTTQQITPLNARVMLAGTPGAGKSTLAGSWAPDTTLLIDTQGGTRLLEGEHYVQDATNWKAFVDIVNALTTSEHPFKTVVIDMIDDVWNFCDAAHAGKGKALATATDDYSRSAKNAEGEFRHVIGRLLASDLGVWFLSHVREQKDGDNVRYGSRLDNRVLTYVQGACQFVLLAETLGPKRALHTQPTAKFETKARVPLPEPMELDARALYTAMSRGLGSEKQAEPLREQDTTETTTTEQVAA
jgi:hypothetical protein